MTTDDGLMRPSVARHYVQRIQRRIKFLEWRIDAITTNPDDDRDPHFDIAELAALRWAIPILEVEWNNLARMYRAYHNLPESPLAVNEKALYQRQKKAERIRLMTLAKKYGPLETAAEEMDEAIATLIDAFSELASADETERRDAQENLTQAISDALLPAHNFLKVLTEAWEQE